jgi:hypothetical protein
MKDKGLMYVCIGIVLAVSTIFAIKYNSLKQAYHKVEKEKVDYCTKYYREKDRVYDNIGLEQDTSTYFGARIRIYYPDATDTIIDIYGWNAVFGFTTDVYNIGAHDTRPGGLMRHIVIKW